MSREAVREGRSTELVPNERHGADLPCLLPASLSSVPWDFGWASAKPLSLCGVRRGRIRQILDIFMPILNISSGRWEQSEPCIWAIRCCCYLRILEIGAKTGRVSCAGHWRGDSQKSLLHFLTLLFSLEWIPPVQLLCCRIPSVGPSIWTLYILSPCHVLEQLQVGEGDFLPQDVGQPVKTNKTSKQLCHIQLHLGSAGFFSSAVQNG